MQENLENGNTERPIVGAGSSAPIHLACGPARRPGGRERRRQQGPRRATVAPDGIITNHRAEIFPTRECILATYPVSP